MNLNLLKILLNNNSSNISGELNKDMKKWLLKNILLELNKNRLNKGLNNKEVNKYMNELNNKGNKLQHLNTMNIWSTQIYNYNKNLEINTTILDKLVTKLLYKLTTLKLLKNNNVILKNILISKPIFEHTTNRVNIKFYYYYKSSGINNTNLNKINNYYLSTISKLMNLLNNDNNNLSKILSYYYNKKITIEPIKLSYTYLNSDIFSQSINKDVNKYNNGIKGQYSRLLNSNIPNLNDQIIAKNYINNINNINNIKYNNIINNLNNSSTHYIKSGVSNIYNSLNINNIPMNILMFKYLTGWSITLNGRLASSKAISRTNTYRVLVGTFRNKKYLWGHINNNYKLNYIPANHNISNLSNVNKNGKYNIKVKLNFI
uniref:Small ribosomal subunit protein uS3m n=1 Tax=Lachancea thermotolerans TaxID=381046 RepID=A0A077X585_LACTH|nr:putative mitochondrial ribosomal protein VAR1 [Lachancea thermotolerans]